VRNPRRNCLNTCTHWSATNCYEHMHNLYYVVEYRWVLEQHTERILNCVVEYNLYTIAIRRKFLQWENFDNFTTGSCSKSVVWFFPCSEVAPLRTIRRQRTFVPVYRIANALYVSCTIAFYGELYFVIDYCGQLKETIAVTFVQRNSSRTKDQQMSP